MKRGDTVLITVERDGFTKGQTAKITEVAFQTSLPHCASHKETVERKAIYVDAGNGWQRKFFSDEYIYIEGFGYDELRTVQQNILKGVFG